MEAAVIGLQSEQWGQKVAAILVLDSKHSATGSREGKPWGILDLRRALKEKLSDYKIPQEMRVLDGGIPRNAMGKGKLNTPLTIIGLFSILYKG